MASLSSERCEPRVAMMALAKVTWEDGTGTSYAASVTIEDTSSYGACIRTRAPIAIGSRLKVDWRGGRFSGVAKYCRQYRDDFIVGVQRDLRDGSARPGSSPVTTMNRQAPAGAKIPNTAAQAPALPAARGQASPPISVTSLPAGASVENPTGAAPIDARPAPPLLNTTTEDSTKWLRREPRPDRKDAANKMMASPEPNDAKRVGIDLPAHRSPQTRPVAEGPAVSGPLLQIEDIYRAKGIIGLRMGYSIHKVVEMLGSNHARDLPPEMKRASVLMALDAAGVPLDDVLRDAELRVEALNTYETDQERQLAEYESRKVQENAAIQAEMERVTAHYLERLKRNMDDVTQMRAPFAAWQAAKQQEAQRIAEAVELCSKSAPEISPSVSASSRG